MQSFFKKKYLISLILSITLGAVIVVANIWFAHNRSSAPENGNLDQTTLDGQINALTLAIEWSPENVKNYIDLGSLYLQKVRETADTSYYQKIDTLMDKAYKIDPFHPDIPAIQGNMNLGKHNFIQAKTDAEKAILLNPANHLYYGLLGDAEIELGHYQEAVEAFQKMVDIRPSYSSYIRIAYVRELYGDIKGAEEFLNLAINSGSSFKENIAFAYVELGKIHMRDNLTEGASDFNIALTILPGYAPALSGLGKIYFFKGDFLEAEKYFKQAYNAIPSAEHATNLADFYFKQGEQNMSTQYLTLAQVAYDSSRSSEVNADLEESLFLSDHDISLDRAVAMAQNTYAERKGIYVADTLSWALYKSGKTEEALRYSKEALQLGETDPLILFHQGMIAFKSGNMKTAKKYLTKSRDINPNISIINASILKQTLLSL